MPHKDAICVYCHKPLTIGRVHPNLTVFHGECRLNYLRVRYREATCDLERDMITVQAQAIKEHLLTLQQNKTE